MAWIRFEQEGDKEISWINLTGMLGNSEKMEFHQIRPEHEALRVLVTEILV